MRDVIIRFMSFINGVVGPTGKLVRVVELVTSSLMKSEAVALIVLGEAVQVCRDPRSLSLVYPRVVNR
jgi:hypothetical protein